ncbi:zinc-dependent alcohol dehydrogenase family protein [Dyella halodurans]|uniref:Zinc-dependent alcohol dehydrogenase family protein n=1 Tax=Dyella halodurans TaxID=1920171 RepID=A0ABV9C2C8_9GAMM|nr:zinc-dependent alcohol dehydrogenase family protein [Dyella halodurans]
MRTVRIRSWGGPEVLRLEEHPPEEPGPAEVRLRVRAIGINRTEVTLRSGRAATSPALPSKIGFEAVGEIDALGPEVSGFAIGERVAVIPAFPAAQYGLYGELSLAPARSLVRIPEGVTDVDAASTWVAFGTAWAGLIDRGRLSAGQTVLVTAASSSVGLAALQIAKSVGARVIAATSSPSKAAALQAHGADAVVVTSTHGLKAAVFKFTRDKGVDLVFDAIGGPLFAILSELAAPQGTLVLYGALSQQVALLSPLAVLSEELTIRGLSLTKTTRDDTKLAALKAFVDGGFERGLFKTTLAKTFTLDDIVGAHRYMEAGEHVGKIVVTV